MIFIYIVDVCFIGRRNLPTSAGNHWQHLLHNVVLVHLTTCENHNSQYGLLDTVKPVLRGHLWDKEKVAF